MTDGFLCRVLIVEDEPALAAALAVVVRRGGAEPVLAHSCARALTVLEGGKIDLILLDLGLPDANGFEVLRRMPNQGGPRPETIVLTAHGELENAIEARRLGVREFFDKPLDLASFQNALAKALEIATARAVMPPEPVPPSPGTYIGASEPMRQVFQHIAHACADHSPVLIEGETGTGKTLTARLIHSHRAGAEGCLEALSAAARDFEERSGSAFVPGGAHRGVLIEEIAGLSSGAQVRLADWLDETASTRLLATTSVPLWPLVEEGAFLPRLFYRLQPGRLVLPPLRQRRGDVPSLAAWFLGQIRPGVSLQISPPAMDLLEAYDWPGNLRELRNALTIACQTMGARLGIEPGDLPLDLRGGRRSLQVKEDDSLEGFLRRWLDARLQATPEISYRELSDAIESVILKNLLRRHHGKQSRLAAARGLNRSTLRRRLQDLGIETRGEE